MINIKQIIERYKTDKTFKTKVLKSTGLALFAIVVLIFISIKDNKKTEEIDTTTQKENKAPVDDYFIADTSNIIDDKNEIYKEDEITKSNGSELNLGKVDNENNSENLNIDNHIKKREEQLNRMNKSNTYSNTPKRRIYNPNPEMEIVRRNYNNDSDEEILEDEPVKKTTEKVEESSSNNSFFKKSKSAKANNNFLQIMASVHSNQTIMDNQRVKLRTTKEFIYNGATFPINTIIYGLAKIKPNRVIIEVNKVNQTDIKLEVYDSEDSEKGLYVLTPNLNASLQKELKREGIEDDDLRAIPFSRSLRNIFEKKVKEEKVQLINNYKVIIKLRENEKN